MEVRPVASEEMAPKFGAWAVGVFFGIALASGYFVAFPVTDTEYVTETNTVTEYVSPNATTFVIREGASTPLSWDWPVTVEFQHATSDYNWTTAWVARVREGDPFAVGLDPEQRYRVHVESASGEERVVGAIVPKYEDEPVEIVLWAGCTDDFSGVTGDGE